MFSYATRKKNLDFQQGNLRECVYYYFWNFFHIVILAYIHQSRNCVKLRIE